MLLDERSDPDFRTVFGLLAERSTAIDVAVARIRLAGIDLREEELSGVRRIRVLMAEISAFAFANEAEAVLLDPGRRTNLELLVRLLREGRIDVRSAPLAGWSPDFSIFHQGGRPTRLIVGTHWFQRPYPHRGPALASVHGTSEAGRVTRRFQDLWAGGHDLQPAVRVLLERALERAGPGL